MEAKYFKYFKTIEKDGLADGASFTDDWYPDTDVVLRRVYLKNKDGTAFTDSTFYLKITEDVLTYAIVPAAILGPDKEISPILDIPVKARELISWTFKNKEGRTIDLFIVFEFWTDTPRV